MSTLAVVGYNNKKEPVSEVSKMAKQLDWAAHESCDHVPNEVTLAAMREADAAIARAKAGKGRNLSLEEMLKELLPDVDAGLPDAV